MSTEIITKEDLQTFRMELYKDLKDLILSKQDDQKQWLRSREVRKLLNISAGTLQNYRISGKLKSSKIGGIHYYKYSDIDDLLNSDNG